MSSRSFGFAWVHSCAPGCSRVHSGSHRFILAQIAVVGYIRVPRGFTLARVWAAGFAGVRVGFLGGTLWTSGSLLFAWDHSCVLRGGRVHLGSFGFGWVYLGGPRCRRVQQR